MLVATIIYHIPRWLQQLFGNKGKYMMRKWFLIRICICLPFCTSLKGSQKENVSTAHTDVFQYKRHWTAVGLRWAVCCCTRLDGSDESLERFLGAERVLRSGLSARSTSTQRRKVMLFCTVYCLWVCSGGVDHCSSNCISLVILYLVPPTTPKEMWKGGC